MKSAKSRQQGMTLPGIVIVLAIIAITVLFTLRIIPLYSEKMTVVSAMNTIAKRPDADSMSVEEIRKYFLRNIEATSNIDRFTDTTVKEMVKVEKPGSKGRKRILHVTYQATNVLFRDLNLLLIFDEKMELSGPVGGE